MIVKKLIHPDSPDSGRGKTCNPVRQKLCCNCQDSSGGGRIWK